MLLDAMLMHWLLCRADGREPGPPDARATVAVVVADDAFGELERIGAAWALSVKRPARGRLALVEGPARVVEGLAAVVVTALT